MSGRVLLKDIQHLPAILRLRHDFEILLQGQQLAKTVAKDRMVVGHYDANLGPCGYPHTGQGPACGGVVVRHTFPLGLIVKS